MVEGNARTGLSRRSFLKASAAVGGVAAVGELSALSPSEALAEVDEHEVVCVCGCNCQGNCSVIGTVREGRLVNVRANENLPIMAYERICNRGFVHPQRLYDFNRVKYPMKRKTWSLREPHVENRGKDEWERISWDEAFKLIAEAIQYNIDNYGEKTNCLLASAGNPFAVFGGSSVGTSFGSMYGMSKLDVCLDYGDLHGLGNVTGAGWDFNQRNMAGDYRFARTLLIWDSNPVNSEPHNWHFCIEAKEAGANLVVIDPTFTASAAQATKWVPIKPGTDPALALAMINVIIENKWYDLDFMLNKTCAPILIREDNGHMLRSTDFGEAGPAELPEYPFGGSLVLAASKAGAVPSEEATAIFMVVDSESGEAVGLHDTLKPALEGSYEVQGVKASTAYTLLKNHIAKYTPSWAESVCEVPADTIVELARMYACETPSTIYAGYHLYDNCGELGHCWGTLAALTGNIGKRGASVGHLGKNKPYLNQAGNLFPTGFAKYSDDIPWLVVKDIMETGQYKGKPFSIQLLYNICANPVGSYGNQKYIIEHMFPHIPCIITSDMEFTDTTEYSDFVLPCCHYFETDWIQASSHTPFLYMANKAVEPIGEAKSDLNIFRGISAVLGDPGANAFYAKSDEEMMRYVVDTPNAAAMGIDLDTLKKKGVLADRDENWIHWEEQIWPTLSGRLEFYVENPGARINIGMPIDKEMYRLPAYREPHEAYDGSEEHKKYPLYHYCERVRWHMHTQFNNVPWLREIDPEPYLRMNPKDAEARGLKNGDIIEAYNDRGHAVCRLKLDNAIRPGMVSSPKGWPRALYIAGSYQELTGDYINKFHQNTSFDDTLVEVRKWEGEVK